MSEAVSTSQQEQTCPITGNQGTTNEPAPPPPQQIPVPDGFPPALIGRALRVVELFHTFRSDLVPAKAKDDTNANDEGSDADNGEMGNLTMMAFFHNIARNDLEAFTFVCKHLAILLKCLRRLEREAANEENLMNDRRDVYDELEGEEEEEEEEENGEGHKILTLQPKMSFITELVRRKLMQKKQDQRNKAFSEEWELLAGTLEHKDYQQLTVQQRLVLFEGLMGLLMKLSYNMRLLDQYCNPLGRLKSGANIWWLSCAPFMLIVEKPRNMLAQPQASTSDDISHEELQAGSGGGPETWQCYSTQEDLEQLRQHLSSYWSEATIKVIDKIIRERQIHEEQRRLLAQPSTSGEPEPVRGTVGEYLRAKFISRLIGWAELLHSELPPGSCISQHRLRHYLLGSTLPSELADCLLQFENRLALTMRNCGAARQHWRDGVSKCATLAGLNLQLQLLLCTNRPLAMRLEHRRAVCRSCKTPVATKPLFCYGCCCNYHRACLLKEASASAAEAAPTSRRIIGVWLCEKCQKSREKVTRAATKASSKDSADDGNNDGACGSGSMDRPDQLLPPPVPPTPPKSPGPSQDGSSKDTGSSGAASEADSTQSRTSQSLKLLKNRLDAGCATNSTQPSKIVQEAAANSSSQWTASNSTGSMSQLNRPVVKTEPSSIDGGACIVFESIVFGSVQRPAVNLVEKNDPVNAETPADGSAQHPVNLSAEEALPTENSEINAGDEAMETPADGSAQHPVNLSAEEALPTEDSEISASDEAMETPADGSAQHPVNLPAEEALPTEDSEISASDEATEVDTSSSPPTEPISTTSTQPASPELISDFNQPAVSSNTAGQPGIAAPQQLALTTLASASHAPDNSGNGAANRDTSSPETPPAKRLKLLIGAVAAAFKGNGLEEKPDEAD